MYDLDGYKEYWGLDTDDPIPNYNPGVDITQSLLKDYCNQFPTTEDEYNGLTEAQQVWVNKAFYIQQKQVLAFFDYYSNSGGEIITSQTVGRTSVSYDASSMRPSQDINGIAQRMLDNSGICDNSIDLMVGYDCGCGGY